MKRTKVISFENGFDVCWRIVIISKCNDKLIIKLTIVDLGKKTMCAHHNETLSSRTFIMLAGPPYTVYCTHHYRY